MTSAQWSDKYIWIKKKQLTICKVAFRVPQMLKLLLSAST